MARYIDADKLEEKLEELNPIDYGSMSSYEVHNAAREVLCDVRFMVDAHPTANVKEVVRGEWEDTGAYVITAYDGSLDVYTCSNCNEDITIDEHDDFCPNCGADMRKE